LRSAGAKAIILKLFDNLLSVLVLYTDVTRVFTANTISIEIFRKFNNLLRSGFIREWHFRPNIKRSFRIYLIVSLMKLFFHHKLLLYKFCICSSLSYVSTSKVMLLPIIWISNIRIAEDSSLIKISLVDESGNSSGSMYKIEKKRCIKVMTEQDFYL
jgi:hypothetical protein